MFTQKELVLNYLKHRIKSYSLAARYHKKMLAESHKLNIGLLFHTCPSNYEITALLNVYCSLKSNRLHAKPSNCYKYIAELLRISNTLSRDYSLQLDATNLIDRESVKSFSRLVKLLKVCNES